ncbi:hypothetical protein ACFL96_13355 [Thermoproteota archaeon]
MEREKQLRSSDFPFPNRTKPKALAVYESIVVAAVINIYFHLTVYESIVVAAVIVVDSKNPRKLYISTVQQVYLR